MRTEVYFLLALCVVTHVNSEECSSLRSCEDCIRKVGCSWIMGDYHEPNNAACVESNSTYPNKYTPGSSLFIVKDESTALVRPQMVHLHLRLYSPVFFYVRFTDTEESLTIPHHPDILLQLLRKKPEEGLVRIEAVRCPKDVAEYHQTINLPSTRTHQNIVLDINLNCQCPF